MFYKDIEIPLHQDNVAYGIQKNILTGIYKKGKQ